MRKGEIWRSGNMAHIGPLSASLHIILLPNQFDSIMPRVLQPGGLSRNMRRHYTACRKLGLLASAKRIMEEEGVTLRRAAERLHISHSLFVRWQQQQAAGVDPILAMLKSKTKSAHTGSLGQSLLSRSCSGTSSSIASRA